MKDVVIKKISVKADIEKLLEKNPYEVNSPACYEYIHAVEILKKRFQPMALLKECPVEMTSGNTILIDGHVYKSKMLRHLLADNQRVFLYLLTMGKMPSELSHIEKFFVNSIKLPIMISAMLHLKEMVKQEHHFEKIAMVNPGLILDWPIDANQTIFETFGSATKSIGVEITKHSYMRPLYSSTGILFEDLFDYCDCETCAIDACIGREAPFIQAD